MNKNCHACQAVGHGWRQCANFYAKLRYGTKLESDPNPPEKVTETAKRNLSNMLDGLESYIVKNQDNNIELLLPPGTPLSKEAPIQGKRRRTNTGNSSAKPVFGHQSWESNNGQG